MTATLARRLAVLERAAWDRHKRELLHAAFSDVARDRGWTPDRVEREVQAALDEFARMEPAVRAICRQGGTARDLAAYIADRAGMDVDALLAAPTRVRREDAPDSVAVGEATRRPR